MKKELRGDANTARWL